MINEASRSGVVLGGVVVEEEDAEEESAESANLRRGVGVYGPKLKLW